MMRRTLLGAALAMVLLLTTSSPAEAQGLSSIAAAMSNAPTLDKQPGCWDCGSLGGQELCEGGQVPGYFNCRLFWLRCEASSSGCGGAASMPLDPDGGTQYVSRGSRLGIQVIVMAGDPNVRRNCDGVVVARSQSPDDITDVRTRTGTLSL